ncbi:PAS domain S-box protein [Aestuariibacter sp. GS-14]|nr:PAS domain-containing protein [Aestuariibacter sp. GS-14]TPV52760.1 PAS domain S-box protein [Aestuariibacter sp. GS-14]
MSVFNLFNQDALKAAQKLSIMQQKALDNSSAAIMMADATGIITYANQACRQCMEHCGISVSIGQHCDSLKQGLFAQLQQHKSGNAVNVGGVALKLTTTTLMNSIGQADGYVLEWADTTQAQAEHGKLAAMDRAQAVIEFLPDGTIDAANENFLSTSGYTLNDIKGKHHRMFVESAFASSKEYAEFWQSLRQGNIQAGEFKRLNKQGQPFWIQASYNPIFDENRNVVRVVKFATDITQEKLNNANYNGQISAISKSQAVIEFDLNGIILNANENFLSTLGYTLAEIQGKHHSMFVKPELATSEEYKAFWHSLKAGQFFSGEFQRIGKGGRDVWIQASYNPIMDLDGKPFKVVKYASDITAAKYRTADFSGQIDAIGKSQAVIAFTPDGTVLDANQNFLDALGYTLDEIKGQHHRMFVDVATQNSADYKSFWSSLSKGKFFAGEFKRITRSGDEIWIQASYNPILDMNGKVFKVVKFATDITAEKRKNAYFEGQLNAIGKSQAVIEFNMDGSIISANDNFLNALGYRLEEIQGKHHSMFVENGYKNSPEYKHFWENLNKGVFASGEFKRIAKGGREIWIQATYNPILDQNGKPFRVVKFATDVTARTKAVNEIKHVMTQLAKGDLTCKIEQEFEGEFKELGQATDQFIRDIRTTISDVKDVMTRLADGDLTCGIEHEFEGDFKVLGEAINEFVHNMRSTIGEINEAVETINTASSEIATGNADLSSRTEQQASSLEETSSSMEELNGTVKLNAENAEQANNLASQACNVAAEGGEMIKQVVTTMSAINASAQRISDIIGVIDGIAFQTNILALNAAVEAARAGEQGRGFAVVASEVRTLAQRSADAAKDIKELISDSVTKISTGNELVNRSGKTMDDVVMAIKRVNDIMSEIAAASVEQASGIDEVSKAVVQMDEMTQQNAALVEEAAAAAESLRHQAGQLSDRVATFKLEQHTLQSISKTPMLTRKPVIAPSKPAINGHLHTSLPKTKAMLKPAKVADDEWEMF